MSNKPKMFSVLIVLFWCSLLGGSLANAQGSRRWIKVGNVAEGVNYYVDKNSRHVAKDGIRIWEKRIRRDLSRSVLLTEWDCREKKQRIIQFTDYNAQGELVVFVEQPSDWQLVVPDSIAEEFLNLVCTDEPNDSLKPKNVATGFAKVIVKKANLRSEAEATGKVVRELTRGEKLQLIGDEPVGGWYKVLDTKTKREGWLHGNTFKIVSANKPAKK